ncbi:DUF3667 domain-containing protein [Aurantiacibacter sp. MUD61]|uniref:DUF3667 domain-containing protein n=1 Tax=Aurantiacibacter sp. MUD61 TaxID=3009083 RepID=UPI0022F1338E|nr:DUF3667 domain-containing protein [Aurantiacibacter sp. MUD61]
MSDILGGIGSAVEGGLFSRALEPDSGAKPPHPEQPEECKNCGTALTGAYCHACGQRGHVHRTIGAFLHELVHGALHFEGKFWRTLPLLIFKPGQLTRRYIEGQRARFVSPMALFLFTVFLMFAVFQLTGISTPTDVPAGDVVEERVRESTAAEITQLEEQLADETLDQSERDRIESELALLRTFMGQTEPETDDGEESLIESFERGYREAGTTRNAQDAETTAPTVETHDGFLESLGDKWRENPGLMLYKLQANAYKFSWLLIPISIPFVWLLFFWKRRFKAYDHAIFITYSLSFVTLLFVVVSMLGVAGFNPAVWLLPMIFIPPFHLYKQLRYTYELSRFSAFWRLIVLSGFIWIVIALFVQLLLMIGAY